MARKNIILAVTAEQHAAIAAMARASGLTLSNYVRRKLDLPPERKGERKDLARGKPAK